MDSGNLGLAVIVGLIMVAGALERISRSIALLATALEAKNKEGKPKLQV